MLKHAQMSWGSLNTGAIPCYRRRAGALARHILAGRAGQPQMVARSKIGSLGAEVDRNQTDCVAAMVVSRRMVLRIVSHAYFVASSQLGEEQGLGCPILVDDFRGFRNLLGHALRVAVAVVHKRGHRKQDQDVGKA